MEKVTPARRSTVLPLLVLAAVTWALAFLVQAVPVAAEDNLVPHMEKGKAAFERICGSCHGIDKPNNKNMDRPKWAELVATMEGKGAKIADDERELILDYLGMRNVFLTKCTTCHTTERIVEKKQDFPRWKVTVERMAAMNPELMTEGEARSIIAYLTVVMGVTAPKE